MIRQRLEEGLALIIRRDENSRVEWDLVFDVCKNLIGFQSCIFVLEDIKADMNRVNQLRDIYLLSRNDLT